MMLYTFYSNDSIATEDKNKINIKNGILDKHHHRHHQSLLLLHAESRGGRIRRLQTGSFSLMLQYLVTL